jgi:aquaporin Z
MTMTKRLGAEFLGTFWLVLGGCGSAVIAAGFPDVGIGLLGVSLAFGLTVLTMAYAIGHISGCHLNPAVSVGLLFGGRFNAKELFPYMIAQVLGGIFAAWILLQIAGGAPGFSLEAGFASNGFGAHSPGNYSMGAAFLTEFVMTFMFLIIILGATDKRAPEGFAPIAIGLGLTLIHLISIPVTNTSVNPARSTGPALFVIFDVMQGARIDSGSDNRLKRGSFRPVSNKLVVNFGFNLKFPYPGLDKIQQTAKRIVCNLAGSLYRRQHEF